MPAKDLVGSALRGIVRTAREIIANRAMLVFMLAYFSTSMVSIRLSIWRLCTDRPWVWTPLA